MTQAQALLLSLLIEVPVALALCAWWGPGAHRGLRRVALTGLAATLLTHPFAWALLPALHGHLPRYARWLLVEGGVAVIEGLLFWRLGGLHPYRGQLIGWAANALSFGVGLLIFWAQAQG
jgi:hypothetical protein